MTEQDISNAILVGLGAFFTLWVAIPEYRRNKRIRRVSALENRLSEADVHGRCKELRG